MKTLQIIDSGGLYGAERVVLTLVRSLENLEVESTLVSITEPDEPEKAIESEARRLGLSVRRWTLGRGTDLSGARLLAAWARENGVDVLHTHGYKANILIAGMSRKRRKLPVLATLHGFTSMRMLSRMRAYEIAERAALKRADHVAAVSQSLVDRWDLERRYAGRLSIVHNGLPVDESEPSTPPDAVSDFIDGRRCVLAAGRLSPEKGFDVLLDALGSLRHAGFDVRLVLAGEGGGRAELEEQARTLGIEDAVLLPGYVDAVGKIAHVFDAVAIPSRSEGLPVILLEALFAGVPVIATDVGEMPAVLRDCGGGTCIAPEDAPALARRLEEALFSRRESWNGGIVSEKARGLYSATKMAVNYRSLYAGLLEKHECGARHP